MHPYVDTMCLGILGTIGSLRPDSSLGLSSVYDVSALAYTSPSSIQLYDINISLYPLDSASACPRLPSFAPSNFAFRPRPRRQTTGVETSNASGIGTSELIIHSGGGVSVGLHVLLACNATTNASITMV